MSATLVATKLREPGPLRAVNLAHLRRELRSLARYLLRNRQRVTEESRERPEDLVLEIADDALMSYLEMLRRFDGNPGVFLCLHNLASLSVTMAFKSRAWTRHVLVAGREVAEHASARGGRGGRRGGLADEQEVLVALLRGVPRGPALGAE